MVVTLRRWTRAGTALLALAIAAETSAQSAEAVFLRKKDAYLNANGQIPNMVFYNEQVWAWLENLKTGRITSGTLVKDRDGVMRPVGEVITKILRSWGTVYGFDDGYPPYGYGFQWAEFTANTALVWVLLKYGPQITQSDRVFIQAVYDANIQSRDYGSGSENSRLHDMVGRYLWAQYKPEVESIFSYNPPPNQNIFAFTWNGNSYTPGNTYKSYALTRDWLQMIMDKWVQLGNAEMDSPHYSWTFFHAFCALYENAVNPEMKRRAQMMLDFLFIESGMDYSANHWGGALGRSYKNTIYNGRTRGYWDFFWDTVPTGYEPGYGFLVSSYRLPPVIWDAVDLNDEPDNYHHLNMEYNKSLVRATGTGKWTYVTRFFNLGGRIGEGWNLNVKSTDTPGAYKRPGVPFSLWINTKNEGEGESNPAPGQTYITMGENGYQYKNAMFVKGSKIHSPTSPNSWERDDRDGFWRFLKEGRTMVAIKAVDTLSVAGLEVAVEGVEYASFDQFKQTVLSKCRLNTGSFTTSRGDLIGTAKLPFSYDHGATVRRAGESQSQFVWSFPFSRIQTVDFRGKPIVQWDNGRMTVSRHGVKRVYDFNAWTVTESTFEEDMTRPNPPSNLSIGP